MDYSKHIFFGYIIKGDLQNAIRYIKQFPECSEIYNRFISVFEKEQYIHYDVDSVPNGILTIYQQYYRDVFYLCMDKQSAENKLRLRLIACLGITDTDTALCDLEQSQLESAFGSKGLHFLGGKTGRYYGPYIWKTTETVSYDVELPDGLQTYTVKLLGGVIARSWTDYISFGEVGTGGWIDDDGIINCVKSSYDFDSENFKVSLLNHEAQHARDLEEDKNMSSEKLEYRAKLVELIYSRERNLLLQFAREADSSDPGNGHSMAAYRIIEGYKNKLGTDALSLDIIPIEQIQSVAKCLFEESKDVPFGTIVRL